MASVRDLSRRIKSIKKTKQITRAMKMVATVRYKRALVAFHAAQPYLEDMERLKSRVWSLPEVLRHPLVRSREVRRLGIVIMGSEKGLCGSFNANLFRIALRRIAQEIESGKTVELIVVGRKARDFFKRLPYPVAEFVASAEADIAQAEKFSAEWGQWFTSGRFDEVIVMYNRFKNVMQCIPMGVRLYPMEIDPGEREMPFDALFEPSSYSVCDYGVKKIAGGLLYRVVLESVLSEQGIRMTMMDQATQKADDLTRELTIQMNKARQAKITNELIELTASAEAMRGG